jgi:hypothetical protein
MTKGTKVRIRIPVTGHGHTNGGDTLGDTLLGWLLVGLLAVTPSWLAAGETTTTIIPHQGNVGGVSARETGLPRVSQPSPKVYQD